MELAVEKRDKFGKAVNVLRKAGLIPAELYGRGIENMHLAVNAKEFTKVFGEAGENTVITLKLNKEEYPVIVNDISRSYLTDDIEHIDFYKVRMDEKIKAHIPIEFLGEAPAVKEQGGFLNKTMSEIEVEALPGNLPHSLKIHLESLNELNKSIYVKDIEIPAGVELLIDPEAVIATVTPPTAEEEQPAAPTDVSEVKVEGEEKKAERAAEKAKEEEA